MAIKKAKTDKYKSREERFGEIERLKKEFDDHFGILIDSIPERLQLFHELDKFVENGFSQSRAVRLKGLQRIAHVQLCNRRHNASMIRLEYREDI